MTCTTDIAHNKRLWHFFQDVKYLVAPELIQKGLFRSSETNLQCFLDLLRVWEGKHVQERSASRHVEYESEAWIHAFNTGLYSFRLLKHVGDCFLPSDNLELDLSQLVESLKTTVRALSIWCVADLGRYLILPQKTTSDGFFYTVDEGSKHYHLPDFVVSQRPVSMHFELHWFFAEVIAKVPRLLSQVNNPSIAAQFWRMLFTEDSVMTPVDQAADLASHTDLLKKLDIQKRVTLIFDYPLRSIVFVSQIKADLWVRNGASMRTQALHFRDVTLRECYDDNLFLLQTASAVMDPDLLLMLFIERFELATWLDWSKSQNTLNLDADHMPRVAETLLEVLIYILAERARALGASNEIEARREVIHHLGSSKGITYSSLVRLLPEEVSDLSFTSDGQTKIFDDVLNSVANFKSPDGLQDKGLYELKEELYSELDPWFWHLSRSERTSLESILKEKAKTSEGLVRVPNIDPLPLHSPYRPIVRLINEPLFMRIVFYSIWRATKTREESGQPSVSNDTLLSAGVQLLMIGIAQSSISADSTQSFFSNMSRIQHWVPKDAGLETEQKTMVDLLCTLLDRGSETDIKDHISRVQYILKILEESDDPLAKSIIAKHNKSQQKGLDAMALDSAQESDNEKQKRKLAAKARKAAIMAQMAQAQQSFMDNQEEDWDEELEDAEPQSEDVFHTPSEKRPDERTVQFPTGSCIFCQEDASTHDLRVYGVLGLIQMSDLERFCKVDDTKPELSSFLQDFSWDKEIPRLSGSTPDLSSVNQAIHQSGLHASSCGHIMHMTCFEGYCTSIRVRQMGQPTRNHPEDSSKVEFLCPLCRTLGNALFPIGAPDYPQFVNWSGVEGMHERDTAVTEFPESGLEALENWFSQTAKRKIKKLVFFEGSTDVDEQPASQSISAGLQSFISNLWMLRATTSPSEFRKFDTQQAFEDHVLPIFNVFGGAWHDEVEEADIRARDFEGLWGIVAFTLEALEIQLRGTGQSASAGRFPRVGILDRLTPQLSSFLPVLSSSIITYQEALLANQENREAVIYRLQNLTHPLFFDEDDFCDLHPSDLTPFCLLVRLCGLVHTTLKGSVNDFLMWTRLCWFLCITRSLSSLLVSSKVPTDTMETTYSPALQQLFQCLHLPVTGTLTESQIYKFVESQCLIFARRAVLFSYTFCGMVPPTGTLGFAYDEELLGEPAAQEGLKEDSELSRLTRYLNLPSVESVLNSDVTRRPFFQQLARASSLRIVKEGQIVKSDLLVSLPGVYELVRLPDRYDTLFEKSLHFSCPKCSQTPAMPAMCLVCGQIVCSQSYCCAENGVGECNQHVEVYVFCLMLYICLLDVLFCTDARKRLEFFSKSSKASSSFCMGRKDTL